MKNSEKFKQKLIITKISYALLAIVLIYIITNYIFLKLLPFFDKIVIIPIYIVLIILILVCLLYYLITNNNFSKVEKQKILDELDNKIDKVFEEYGLYITKNYIVCIGNKSNIFKLFVVPIKNINAIDTHSDSRYYYRKRGNEPKHKFLSFITASIKDDLVHKDNDCAVFNIICDKKVYCITTSCYMNKKKIKQINEMADYICEKNNDIDYI